MCFPPLATKRRVRCVLSYQAATIEPRIIQAVQRRGPIPSCRWHPNQHCRVVCRQSLESRAHLDSSADGRRPGTLARTRSGRRRVTEPSARSTRKRIVCCPSGRAVGERARPFPSPTRASPQGFKYPAAPANSPTGWRIQQLTNRPSGGGPHWTAGCKRAAGCGSEVPRVAPSVGREAGPTKSTQVT